MALDFREVGFGFGPLTGRRHELSYTMDFGQKVSKATIALKGFTSQFDKADHELHALEILTRVDRIENTKVFVTVSILLRDYSNNIDDKYSGSVHIIIFADVVTNALPPIFINYKAKKSKTNLKKKAVKKTL